MVTEITYFKIYMCSICQLNTLPCPSEFWLMQLPKFTIMSFPPNYHCIIFRCDSTLGVAYLNMCTECDSFQLDI